MFAVDTSKSMRAADLRPDRLTRAKLAVADLVRTFEGARVGLIAFAGDAFVQAPMTIDHGVFLESLDVLDTEVIPKGGTDIASAIRAAEQAMGSEPDHEKVLVVLSDGEDLAGDVVATAKDAASHGLKIFTVGVGSTAGSLIEVPDGRGHTELVRDEAGNPVRSHLDEPTLRSIAQVTGGAYQALGADGHGLERLYASVKAKLPATTAAGTERKVFSERYQIPLALAIGCLLLELAIVDHRRGSRRAGAVASVGLAFMFVPHLAAAAPAPGERTPVETYNAATDQYRKRDFTSAQRGFETALHTANVAHQEAAYYDLGNTHYRVGQASLAKDRDATIATWKSALAAYDAALALVPYDADAKFNRDFVAKKLAALEQQKKDDEQQNKDHQKDQKDQKDQQAKNQQGQGQPKDQKGEGEQAKNQQGQGQPTDQKGQQDQGQPRDQKGEGQQAKNQQGQGQPKDPKGQEGQGQPKDQKDEGQQAKNQQGQQNAPDAASAAQPPAAGTPAAAAQQAATNANAAADAKRRAAGELTHGEAVQLLDSVEGELKPMAIRGRTHHPTATSKTKDW